MAKFDRRVNTLYLDLDGVLADFDKFIHNRMGEIFPQNQNVDDSRMWNYINKVDRFFYRLEPTPYAYRLFNLALSVADNVEILTALPSKVGVTPTAREDKIEWVRKHFSKTIKVNFGPYSKDKWKHAKPSDILIDDRTDNISSWNRAGGIGILHYYSNFDRTVKLLLNAVK